MNTGFVMDKEILQSNYEHDLYKGGKLRTRLQHLDTTFLTSSDMWLVEPLGAVLRMMALWGGGVHYQVT